MTAAPPKRAAAPTAPVIIGIAAPSEELEPPADVAAGKVVVAVATPLVKGTPSVPELWTKQLRADAY